MRKPRLLTSLVLLTVVLCAFVSLAHAQVDKLDAQKKGAAAIAKMTLRVRAIKVSPEPKAVRIAWRRGGEGLGGSVTRGDFALKNAAEPDIDKKIEAGKQLDISVGAWSDWLPLETVVGRPGGWQFPTLVVLAFPTGDPKKPAPAVTSTVVEFEFVESGKVFKSFRESAPRGCTVRFAFPGGALGEKGSASPGFVDQFQGLADCARARRERVEKLFPASGPVPKKFAVIGHLGGYGDAAQNKGRGFGIRHNNPEILLDECRTLRRLGVNGLVDTIRLADAVGQGDAFRRMYWGGPGSGSPVYSVRGGKTVETCPFDPELGPRMAARVSDAIKDYRAVNACESWALWWDEIGVAAKDHILTCPRCQNAFREYLRVQGIRLDDLAKARWDQVTPYPIWKPADPKAKGSPTVDPATLSAPDALRYYYTFRFMTHATAQLFPASSKQLKEAGIPLYAMQGPTPSWEGHSLDWHEFYDGGPNSAFVFETSNRDPRVWQWESYLGDIGRSIAARHGMPMGALIKPHRGAPEQRMLTLVARGAGTFEWYTYGPDYAKGDSFSQRPDLLERVDRAGQFLGKAEDWLYGARWAGPAEVAFVSPRSSEIWGKATDLGVTAFEDAKWVYSALTHAHVPVDILSEQQLAAGKLGQYKVLYIVGPNLRRDAAVRVQEWVRTGGTLWTDALGLSRDEANQPATALADLLGLGKRKLESWGSVPAYHATALLPLKETAVPAHASLSWKSGGVWGTGDARGAVGREALTPKDGDVLAKFADGKPAVVRRKVGKGEVVVVGLWAGLTYSAKVRRAEFEMRTDFDQAVRALIVAPALARRAYRPVVPAEPLVEAVLLKNDRRRSIALINWGYRHDRTLQTVKDLRVALPGAGDVKSVQSLAHGPLKAAQPQELAFGVRR